MKGIKAIVSGIKWMIDFFKQLWSFVQNIVNGITTAFQILIKIITMTITTITTLPSWIQGFLMITITITIAYFIIGRNTGKSDTR